MKTCSILILILSLLLTSTNIFSQDCNITSKANDILPDRLCAPVSLTWEVTYRGVNDGGTPIQIEFNWDDGAGVELVPAINTNPNPAIREWKVTVAHTYPQGGNRCNYRPTAALRVNGILCTSSIQQQNVTVWDTDIYNGGQIAINPQVFPICVGNDGTVIFNDVSLFNCVPPVENDNPNTPTRWTQWIYGTSYTINNVLVNGAPHAYPFADAIYPHLGPVTGPTPPNISTLPIYSPNTALVNQFFQVTLRYWNICNPYDDPNIPGPPANTADGDYPPVITTAQILIVPYPNATINPAGPFCSNDPAVFLSAATPGGTWAGPGITNASTGRFNPSTAGPGIHTITYSVTNGYGCTGTDDIQITVFARPTINVLPGTNLQVCPGDNLQIDGNPTPGGGAITTHLWTGNTAPLSATNIQNPVFNTNTQGTYNLTYSVTDANGCTRSQSITVTVNPVSAHIIPDPAEACAGINFTLNGNPTGGTGTYTTHTWTGDTGPLNVTNVQSPVFNTTTLGNYTLNYTVFDNNGCTANDDVTVTVFDVPVAVAGTNDTICGLSINLNATPSIGVGLWSKETGPGTATFAPAGSPSTTVTVSSYGTYNLIWTEVFGPNCTSKDTLTIVFIEQPNPNAGSDFNLCGLSYNLNATPSVGTGMWLQASGPASAVFANPNSPTSNVSTNTYGLYHFVWYENNGYSCYNSDTVAIAFDVVPAPNFTPIDSMGCPPFIIPFNNNTLYGSTYSWDFGNGQTSNIENPTITFTNSGPANVTYTIKMKAWSTYGCTDSIYHTITVNPVPIANFNSNAVPGCSPVHVNFTNTSFGASSYFWDYGDGQTQSGITNTSHTFINNSNLIQYYPVNLIAYNTYGCPDTTTQYVTVFPDPEYTITVDPDSSCSPVNSTLSTQAGAQTYFWNFGDGNSQYGNHTIQHFYTNTTTNPIIYTIQLVATSALGCVDTSFSQIKVFPSPTALFSNPVTSGCHPFQAQFINTSIGVTSYLWNFGDGNTSTQNQSSINHTYVNSGGVNQSFTAWLYVENSFGCRDSMSSNLTVFPNPAYTISIDPDSTCSPVNAMIQTQPGALSYDWNYGDGTFDIGTYSTQHIYTNNSTQPLNFNVRLITTSNLGCKDTCYQIITVLPKPQAAVSVNPNSGCTPLQVQFTNSSSGANSFFWYFGDGTSGFSTNMVVSHTFENSQSVPVTFSSWLTVQNVWGCKDSINRTITVNPAVIANFNCDTIGCSPLSIDFTNFTFGATQYLWNFGDGTTSSQSAPNHSFINNTISPLNFPVTLTATSQYGCQGTFNETIQVYPVPLSSFSASPSVQTFPSSTVAIVNNSVQGTWTYSWDFGDGATTIVPQPGSHIYSNYGTYNIELIVKNLMCSDTSETTIQIVAPPPIASFTIAPNNGCAPLTVQLTNTSQYAESYVWDFGDGGISSQPNPEYTYTNSGTYYIKLTAIGPGGQHQSTGGPVTVFPQATAYFNVSPTVVFIPDEPILCFNLSQNTTIYQWDFGDGTGSTETSPNHYYQEEGEFNITLFATNIHNCADSFTVFRAVIAKASGLIEFPSAFTPNPFGPNGGSYIPGDMNNDIFHPEHVGIEDYILSIFNRWGELIFETKEIGIGWDGYYRGEICKQDVYVWKVKGKFINGKSFMEAGDVTLLR